jgi:hypothetical protein
MKYHVDFNKLMNGPLEHVFHEKQWNLDGKLFKTNDAILSTVPYNPRILFIGTFNPNQPTNNPEFFYGRNYFWPVIFNVFQYKSFRFGTNGIFHAADLNIIAILEFCEKHGIVFADLISQILHLGNQRYQWHNTSGKGRKAIKLFYQNKEYNLISDYTVKKKERYIYGLNDLDSNQVDWNNKRIIKFLQETKTIETVYITCNPSGNFKRKWLDISNARNYSRKIDFRRIFTPSGLGSKKGYKKIPYITQHWLGKFGNYNFDGIDCKWISNHLTKSEIQKLLK